MLILAVGMLKAIVGIIKKHPFEIGLILLSISVLFLYSLNFSDSFLVGFDDDWCINENPDVQNLNVENLKKIWLNQTVHDLYVPVTFTSFAIDVAIWGNNAFNMKVENILLHIISSFLLYYFLIQLKVSKSVAFTTIVLFLFHPLQVENIAWPTCRRRILSITFTLLTAITYLKFIVNYKNKYLYYILSIIFFFLAIMAKPTSIVLLPMIVASMFIYRYENKEHFSLFFRDCFCLIPYLLSVTYSLIMNSIASQRNFLHTVFEYSIEEHLLIILSSFGFYIEKILYGPYIILYFLPSEIDIFSIDILSKSLITISLFFLFVLFFKQKKYISALSIVWYVLALAPSAFLLILTSDLQANTADRYFLMASPGIFLLMATGIHQFFKRYAIPVSLLLIVPMAYATYQQTKVWNDSGTVIEHCLSVNPTEEMLYRSALYYYEKGEVNLAFEHLREAKFLQKGAMFNSPFFTDLQIAYLYQEMGDTVEAKNIIVSAFQKDLSMAESSLTFEILQQKASELFPLEYGSQEDAYRYIQIRRRLLKDHPGVLLRPKRL